MEENMHCLCGELVIYFEPVQKSYMVFEDGTIDWDSGKTVDEDLSNIGEAECLVCSQKYVTEGRGDNVRVIRVSSDKEANQNA